MKKPTKILIIATVLLIVVWSIFQMASNWTTSIMQDKPSGPEYLNQSDNTLLNGNIYIALYIADKQKFFSLDMSDSFSTTEIWLESNENKQENDSTISHFNYALNICFEQVSKNDLYKFKLIPYIDSSKQENKQVKSPDDNQQVRFLLNDIPDTIKIEIIERNPNDSIYWSTETVLDTITLIKAKRP